MRGRQPKIQWLGPSGTALTWVAFPPEDEDPKAPWRDERFRQAVSMAIDRDAQTNLISNVTNLKKAGLDVDQSWNNIVP